MFANLNSIFDRSGRKARKNEVIRREREREIHIHCLQSIHILDALFEIQKQGFPRSLPDDFSILCEHHGTEQVHKACQLLSHITKILSTDIHCDSDVETVVENIIEHRFIGTKHNYIGSVIYLELGRRLDVFRDAVNSNLAEAISHILSEAADTRPATKYHLNFSRVDVNMFFRSVESPVFEQAQQRLQSLGNATRKLAWERYEEHIDDDEANERLERIFIEFHCEFSRKAVHKSYGNALRSIAFSMR